MGCAASRRSLRAALLVACCYTALGMPSWYTCDPATCQPPDCECASTAPPDGLPADQTPQFIVLTHDDAIAANTNVGMRAIMDQHTNRNGCNMPATFFVLEVGTQCELAKVFWEQNSEIAVHSKTHVQMTDPFPGPNTLEDEMFSVRNYLNTTCGIPLEDMVGFRAPLLSHNPAQRELLVKNGMLYDSSMIEFWGNNSEIAKDGYSRLWPYTMDAGIPQNCLYFAGNKCTQEERYPGLWEFPVHNTQAENGTLLYSMDPGRNTQGEGYGAASTGDMPPAELEALLKKNFDYSYYGNRTPFGLYVHTPWLTDDNIQVANNFFKYALGLNDTWVVTMSQVIKWMQDPVPVDEMDEWLTCNPVDLSKAPGVQKCQVYTAKMGDSGDQIASSFGVSLPELMTLNPNLERLQAGDQVKIPPFDESCGTGTPSTGPSEGGARRLQMRRAGPQ